MSASTVCGVGSRMSIRRLCVRISNCSRDFLSTWGERRTVHLFLEVGSGIGPATRAPVRLAVSTISDVDWSSTRWSYALSLILIFSFSMSFFLSLPRSAFELRPRPVSRPGAVRLRLLDDVGDGAGPDGAAPLPDREPQPLLQGDRR